eukprot:SAG11_NODE_456_length_9319_cov_5.131128_9_plen_260_part_00
MPGEESCSWVAFVVAQLANCAASASDAYAKTIRRECSSAPSAQSELVLLHHTHRLGAKMLASFALPELPCDPLSCHLRVPRPRARPSDCCPLRALHQNYLVQNYMVFSPLPASDIAVAPAPITLPQSPCPPPPVSRRHPTATESHCRCHRAARSSLWSAVSAASPTEGLELAAALLSAGVVYAVSAATFLVMLGRLTLPAHAAAKALCRREKKPLHPLLPSPPSLSSSIGVVRCSGSDRLLDGLLPRADGAGQHTWLLR